MTGGRAAALAAVVAVMAAASGCAGPSSLLASPREYAAYRETRIAATFDGRLAAAGAYLLRYPKGAFAPEVRAYLARAEPVYFAAKRGSVAGLSAYLSVLPNGAFVAQATRRLKELREARSTVGAPSRAVEETEARLEEEQAERKAVRDHVAEWIGRFLDASVFERPLSEAATSVIVPFSLALPSPLCAWLDGPDGPTLSVRCAKLLGLPYTVKVEGDSEEREATVEVAVVEDPDGKPVEVTIGGPDLFLRLEETRSVRALPTDDAAARIGGISLAVELAGAAFRKRVSDDPACRRPVVAPVVLDLGCHGVRLEVRAALEPGGDDTVAITPYGPPPAPPAPSQASGSE